MKNFKIKETSRVKFTNTKIENSGILSKQFSYSEKSKLKKLEKFHNS